MTQLQRAKKRKPATSGAARDALAERVLVHAPLIDLELSPRALAREGLWTTACPTLLHLCAELEAGAAVAVLAEEALSTAALARLTSVLAAQPGWSDLPIIVCTAGSDVLGAAARSRALEELGNVVLVERPVPMRALLAAVRSALRTRRRQLALRDAHAELERLTAQRTRLLDSVHAARADAEEASRARDEFLDMISHELRTPLNAILGWSRMLSAGRLSGAQRERAALTIERNAVAQAKLVDELLDVSRIISKKVKLSLRPLELGPIVESVVGSLRAAAEAKNHALTVVVPAQAPSVLGDPERLTQVLSNLVGNAIKFTPAGGRIDVSVSVGLGGDAPARLTVRDDGIGIHEEFRSLVFDRFRQVDGSRTRAHGGLGLGLAIVRHLVELHGGEITVASDGVGKGAEFVVSLPRHVPPPIDERPSLGSDRPPASRTVALSGPRARGGPR